MIERIRGGDAILRVEGQHFTPEWGTCISDICTFLQTARHPTDKTNTQKARHTRAYTQTHSNKRGKDKVLCIVAIPHSLPATCVCELMFVHVCVHVFEHARACVRVDARRDLERSVGCSYFVDCMRITAGESTVKTKKQNAVAYSHERKKTKRK